VSKLSQTRDRLHLLGCGQPLGSVAVSPLWDRIKVSRRTLKAILGILILLPFMIWGAIAICRLYSIEDDRRQDLVFAAIAGPTLLGVGFWDWKTGYYALRDKRNIQPSGRN